MGDGSLLEVTSADGATIGVEVVGSGPSLVAMHGSTADRSRWAPVREALSRHFTLYLVDRRGRGASTGDPDSYALRRETEDVVAVAAACDDLPGYLGHSYGAVIGLDLLATAPDTIAAALLYEPPFDIGGHTTFPPGFLDAYEDLLAAGDREAALQMFYRAVIGIDPEPMRALPIWQARLAAAHTLVREGRIGLRYAPGQEDFADVGIPVEILAGTTSPPVFGAAAEAAASAIPGARLTWLEGQGHTMIDADPDGFVRKMLDFFPR
ncbi:alpha/beta hydrolase [Nocardioides panacisoli]|uniref:Alpha/beta hydrolase n=1 Tax=Nocardioides panacisoli TaxID=627624 RepID=A0ABP7I7F7_9ACTN